MIEWIKDRRRSGWAVYGSTRDLAVRPLYRDRLMCVARRFKTKTPGVIMPEMRAETFVVQNATDGRRAGVFGEIPDHSAGDLPRCG